MRLQHGARERAGRTLAVRPRDVDHGRQAALGMAELAQEALDAVQHQVDLLGMQRQKPRQDRIGPRGGQAHACPALSWPLPRETTALTMAGGGEAFFGRERFIIRCTMRDSVSRMSWRLTTMSSRPCSSRYSARWKPSGNCARMVWAMTRAPVKPICAPGSAICTSPSIA